MPLGTEIYIGNDTVIEVTGLQNGIDDSYLNAATVSAVINELDGTEVVSSTTLSYVAASNGNYRGTVDQASISSLSEGTSYYVEITAAESGIDGFWRIPVVADYRGI